MSARPDSTDSAGGVRAVGPDSRRGGFVLVLVVMMLFAISVAGATGYLVVNTEFTMATQASQGAEAVTVARAALQRFAVEQLGVPGDSVSYAMGSGVAMVTTRKVLTVDSDTDLYHIRSEATVFDPLSPATPATRVVGAYAYHQRRPLRNFAALVVAAEAAYAQNSSGVIDGDEHSSSSDCSVGGGPDITGAIARVNTGQISGGSLDGSPNGRTWPGGYSAFYDSIGIRWDVISNPSFPVDFDGVMPNYGSIPSDSFPVVRVHGYFNPGSSWSGRGLLIVNGELDASSSWTWEGIVLAGAVDDIHEGHIRGMLVAGLDGANPYNTVYWRGTIRYYSCNVYRANESLSYLELVENSVYEVS